MPECTLSIQGRTKFAGLPARATLRRWVLAACERDIVLTIRFVDRDEGLMLNSTYRGKDYATNVLTFDYCHGPVVEADIVICVPVLEQQAAEQNKTFREHLAHLVVHGVLHAHGYDHIEQADALVMEALETRILARLGFANPYEDA